MNQAHFLPGGNNDELFVTTGDGIDVYRVYDDGRLQAKGHIDVGGAVNSVDTHDGLVAVAVERGYLPEAAQHDVAELGILVLTAAIVYGVSWWRDRRVERPEP